MVDQVNPNSRTSFTDQTGKLTKYGQDVILKLYRLLGVEGESSTLDDVLFNNIDGSSVNVEDYSLEPILVTADFETFGNCFLRVTTADITVTLNPFPFDGEQAVIFVDGVTNVSVTDGTGTDVLVYDQTVLSYRYSVEFEGWIRGG